MEEAAPDAPSEPEEGPEKKARAKAKKTRAKEKRAVSRQEARPAPESKVLGLVLPAYREDLFSSGTTPRMWFSPSPSPCPARR